MSEHAHNHAAGGGPAARSPSPSSGPGQSPLGGGSEAARQQLAKRQQMLQALQASQLQPLTLPPAAGGVQPRVSLISALGPMVQAFIANKTGEKLKLEEQALAEKSREELRRGMEDYLSTSQGQTRNLTMPAGPGPEAAAAGSDAPVPYIPGTPTAPVENAGTERIAPDPRKAMLDAIASNHPVLQQLGMTQLSQMGKNQLTAKDLLPYANPKAIPSMLGGDMSGFQPKPEIKEAGGSFYDLTDGTPKRIGGQEFAEPVMINNDLYQNEKGSGKLHKLDNAPKTTVAVNASPAIHGQKEGMGAYWKKAGERVDALGQIAGTATNNLQTIAELKNLDANGIFSNVSTGPATFLSNLGQAVGVPVDTAKLGNTETYNALTTDLWQGLVAKYGGNRGVTKEEAAEIKRILPLAANSPQARQQMFSILENVSNRQIKQYQTANRSFASAVQKDDPSAFAADMENVYVPAPNQPAPVTKPGAGPGRVRRFNPQTGRIE